MTQTKQEAYLNEWMERESIAEDMIPMIGKLYRKRNVITSIYGRPIINRSVIQLLKSHRFVRHMEDQELSVHDTFQVLKVIEKMDVARAHIDIGKLAVSYSREGGSQELGNFVRHALQEIVGRTPVESENRDVVLYGFGRIGRLLARILVEKSGGGNGLRLKAIVVRRNKGNDLQKRASLLRRDSVHGTFRGTITVDEENEAIIASGNYIKVIYANDPSDIDYTKYGIHNALVIDNTGVWRDEDGLGQHLRAKGTARVLLTAPGKGEIKNVVYGINSNNITREDKILSAASCTTNAITPVLKVMNDQYGIVSGHVETVHAYTNDQNLIDNYHKGPRRGRSAPLNMVITETGAAQAVAKALPELEGKLTGNAIRVPTPNVSMAILSLNLNAEVSKEKVNNYLREQSLHSSMQKQIDWVCSQEVVSSDFVGNRHAGIVDAEATIVSGSHVNLYVWYDNEYGYSRQVVRIAQDICQVEYPSYPKTSS